MLRLSSALLFIATFIPFSTTLYAGSYPSVVDTRVGSLDEGITSVRPTVIIPDDAYLDLYAIGDIDNDGLQDYRFEIFTNEFYEMFDLDDPIADVECPSSYFALSSLLDDSFAPSEAIEYKGLQLLNGSFVDMYDCFSYFGEVQSKVLTVGDARVLELLFDDEQTVLTFAEIKKGTVVDIADILAGDGGGFTIAPNLKLLDMEVGDVNGDGLADRPFYSLLEDESGFGQKDDFLILDAAALDDIVSLSTVLLPEELKLVEIELNDRPFEIRTAGDFNGDTFGDVLFGFYVEGEGIVDYVSYGASSIQVRAQADSIDSVLTRLDICLEECVISSAGDFNADGFSDVLVINNYAIPDEDLTYHIVYGKASGLPDLLDSRTSTLVRVVSNESSMFYGTNFRNSVGDINGDGASDLILKDTFDDHGVVLLGQKVAIPADINLANLNGDNGFLLFTDKAINISNAEFLRDSTGDGIDDVMAATYSRTEFIPTILEGRLQSDQPSGLRNVSVASGFTETFLSWEVPVKSDELATVEILIDDVLIDTVNANTEFYSLKPTESQGADSVLHLRYVNAEGRQAAEIQLLLGNEFDGLQQLHAQVADESSIKLTWDNQPSNYIVWRDGVQIANVTTNSYIDTNVKAGGEYRYHVTQGMDTYGLYIRPQGLPLEFDPFSLSCDSSCGCGFSGGIEYFDYYDYRVNFERLVYPASTDSLLVKIDSDKKSFSTPSYDSVGEECLLDPDFQLISAGSKVYSSTAFELFWERASHPSGIEGYEVSLFGLSEVVLDATSYFVDDWPAADLYLDFTVTAIAKDGTRSLGANYEIYFPSAEAPATLISSPVVRSEVYSTTAAELFWQPIVDPEGNPVLYQVLRDGEVMALDDALSFFDDSLAPGQRYTYDVVAVGLGSLETLATSTSISTPPDVGVASSAGVLPTGGRGKVYSNNAIELFWDRSDDYARGDYVIYRNSMLIGTTDGITFYDSGLTPETEYQYTVQANDRNGNPVGEPSSVTLKTAR